MLCRILAWMAFLVSACESHCRHSLCLSPVQYIAAPNPQCLLRIKLISAASQSRPKLPSCLRFIGFKMLLTIGGRTITLTFRHSQVRQLLDYPLYPCVGLNRQHLLVASIGDGNLMPLPSGFERLTIISLAPLVIAA